MANQTFDEIFLELYLANLKEKHNHDFSRITTTPSSFSGLGFSEEVLPKLNAIQDILGISISNNDPLFNHKITPLRCHLLEFAFAKDESAMMAVCGKLVKMLKLREELRVGVLFSCLLPLLFPECTLPTFFSEASELQQTQSYVGHLLNLVSLFPNSSTNSDVIISQFTTVSKFFDDQPEFYSLFESSIRPDRTVAFDWTVNNTTCKIIKYISENATNDGCSIHKDFLKVVTLMRHAHSKKMDFCFIDQEEDFHKRIRTYGLLVSKDRIIVLSLRCEGKKRKYLLAKIGSFCTTPGREKSSKASLCEFILATAAESVKEKEQVEEYLLRRKTRTNESSTPLKKQRNSLEISDILTIQLKGKNYLSLKITDIIDDCPKKPVYEAIISNTDNAPKLVVKLNRNNDKVHHPEGSIFLEYINASVIGKPKLRLPCAEVALKGIPLNKFKTEQRSMKAKLIEGLLKELMEIHNQDMIHNDVKPQNIVVIHECTPKLIDWELCEIFTSYDTENEQCIGLHGLPLESEYGTDNYNAPEKFLDKLISPKSDIFSMGLVFIEMVLGNELNDMERKLCITHSKKFWNSKLKNSCNLIRDNLFETLQLMINAEKKERPSAANCLELLGFHSDEQEIVDHFKPFERYYTRSNGPKFCKIQPRRLFETSPQNESTNKRLNHVLGDGIEEEPASKKIK
ncbi:hypothetical protein C9374_011522 [Naegleria lovaniensis]|uniref:Protein kinase domain-containing protein n=1 Tax=Naegleria lovaniensis TaxID=51637 RepID=A0AA88KQZ4_NAELO|nr:uncharacterized protein C9374_011522 [Naegleria lovaniensis]KAG2392797.1 hypothetical protein C9374_011522 [Naegleria lovaniensis]